MRAIFYIAAILCWPLAGVVLLTMNWVHFGGAEGNAEKNRQLIREFRPRVQLVEQYLATKGRLPSYAELNGCSESFPNCGAYSVSSTRPTDPDFQFPPWPPGKTFYAISYWRGEWSEYYDSATRSFSLEKADEASEWRAGWWQSALIAIGLVVMPWLVKKLPIILVVRSLKWATKKSA